MTRVLVVDTSMGNLRSVARALERAGGEVTISADPEVVRGHDRVVVPGQGAFGDCARALEGGLGDALREHLARDRPYFGICLGMQVLFEQSEEAIGVRGLGVLPGRVRRFARDMHDASGRRLKVPHMGWNRVSGGPADGEWFYFVHSFHCAPDQPEVVSATADYGGPFCAAVQRGAMFACQFHPEKSQHAGAELLARFLRSEAWS